MNRLRDRRDAGVRLAALLQPYADDPKAMVVGLPRGGVVTGYEIARALRVPLEILVVRKLGVPWQPELAMGAIASGGGVVMNSDVADGLGISDEEIAAVVEREKKELARREAAYRGNRPPPEFRGWTVIVADDGVATGSTMSVAVQALRRAGAGRIVVAVGVAPPETVRRLEREADEVACVLTPERLDAISLWFEEFAQTEDEEVRRLLADAAASSGH
jgi:putative phosphoribosyl transferase